MKATFITRNEKLRIPTEITKKLNLKHGELIDVQITKLYIDEKLKKEILNRLKHA